MSAMVLPRWFWSEEEEVQPPSRDGWTLLVTPDLEPTPLPPRRALPAPPLNQWLCESLARRPNSL